METTTAELIDSGEKRDALGRKRTPLERRRELVREDRESGLTQAAFARRAGINYTTFCGWAQVEAKKQTQPVKFAQLRLPAAIRWKIGCVQNPRSHRKRCVLVFAHPLHLITNTTTARQLGRKIRPYLG